ncbi:hypothetical protein R1sor_002427 [Riccia sorocarpa]|uniref:Uncharacterized protein n=1 Tax=Riccia sorocarpa TaxID=122646 RepID=A0ABD3GYS9_9MARC
MSDEGMGYSEIDIEKKISSEISILLDVLRSDLTFEGGDEIEKIEKCGRLTADYWRGIAWRESPPIAVVVSW